MKVLCIYNQFAGGGRAKVKLESIKSLFQEKSIDARFELTEDSSSILNVLKSIDLSEYDGLVVAGGDGSFFNVLNAYKKLEQRVDIPLGILPVGTGNSLSRDLIDGETKLESFIDAIAEGKTKLIDIAEVKSNKDTFYYANMMGFGFITDVAQTASKLKVFGATSYTLGVLYNTLKLKPFDLFITIDGVEKKWKNVFVIISNSRYTGGDYLIAPKAKIDDGKLDLIVLNKLSRINLLKTFPKIFDGSHVETPFVDYIHAESIKLLAKKQKALSPDGEIYGKFPVEVSCLPKAIRVFSKI